ncbi:hypothetical protein N0V82_010295 [Gnomoniopsis sp. IMI 355080]|nr:hypothetical protein N0V82_010295 [Gnomoniopsis sp. IMI 355080]
MFVPTDQTGSAEFDHSEWLQFEVPGLEDYDFSTLEMPSFLSWEPLPAFQNPSTEAALQSSRTKTPQPSPPPQPRRTSVVTVQRRSSSRTSEDILSVTVEDPTGRKRSWDVNFDKAFETMFNMIPAGQVLDSTQPQVPMPPLTQEQQHSTFQAEQLSSLSDYMPTAYPNHQFIAPNLPTAQESLVPTSQMVPMLSSPPVDVRRRAGRVPASSQHLPRQAKRLAGAADQQAVRKQPRSSQQRGVQRESHGVRPPLPDDIALFVNTHHLPNNDGRVPDRRGLKDTTVANDYYYSISKLDDLELPACGKSVSYNGVEFDSKLSFTSEQFLEYLHCASQRPNCQPILRIQIQPAQYNHRYIRAGQSFKCRFADCPDKRGTILKGQARVCISEFDDEHGDWLNPYHNTGYVHLFCLEKQTNLIELCNDHPEINIVSETRSLAHEPPATTNRRVNNPMALNDVEQAVVSDWLTDIGNRWNQFKFVHRDSALRPKFELAQEDTLTYRLTKAHMDNGPLRNIQKKRKRNAGGRVTAHLDEHVGDVGKQVALQKKMKKQPPPKKKSPSNSPIARGTPPPEPVAKRRRVTPPLPQSPQHQAMLGGDPVDHSFPDVGGLPPFQPPTQQQTIHVNSEDAASIANISHSNRRSSPRRHRVSPTSLVLSPRGVAKRRPSARRTSSASLEAELEAYLDGLPNEDSLEEIK